MGLVFEFQKKKIEDLKQNQDNYLRSVLMSAVVLKS